MAVKYFGTDGVRGLVGEAPITPNFVMRLGYAAGKVLTKSWVSSNKPVVLIGKDTRISGYILEAALEAGLAAAGVDVMLAGPLPTPAVAYLTRALRLSAGVVISASHNLYQDNGIKFFSALGNKLPDTIETEIEIELDSPMICVSSDKLGKARRLDDAQGRYIEFCKSTFPNALDLRGMKIAIDCANGAAYNIAPHVFHELGAEVITINNQPNGININENCGVTKLDELIKSISTHQADIGIALDGDADRLIMLDASCRIYNGDELLYVIVKDRLAQGSVIGAVGTLMTNVGLEHAFKKMGIIFVRASVGDRYILETLRERGWQLGGECSGHLLCLDKHTTGDGIISALQVLSALRRTGHSLVEMTQDMYLYPQALINIKIPKEFNWKKNICFQNEKKAVEKALGNSGRVLIRPSGTEPLIRIMVEALQADVAQMLAKRIADQIKI